MANEAKSEPVGEEAEAETDPKIKAGNPLDAIIGRKQEGNDLCAIRTRRIQFCIIELNNFWH